MMNMFNVFNNNNEWFNHPPNSQVIIILDNGSRILKIIKHLPRQVLIRQSAPLDSEFLHILAMLAVLRLVQQCIDVFVVFNNDGGGLALGDNTHIQNAVDFGKIRIEKDISTVCV